MISDPDPRWFPLINEFARDTPWLHPIMIGYADYGIVVFAALLLAGWWIARRSGEGPRIAGRRRRAARSGPHMRVMSPRPTHRAGSAVILD